MPPLHTRICNGGIRICNGGIRRLIHRRTTIGSRVSNCPQFPVRLLGAIGANTPPSARRGPVVTGSKPTLAITCYPPVPKRMHLRTTQECSFATVYQSHLCFCHRVLRCAGDLCAGALGVSGCFSVALNATVAISRVSDCGYAIVAHKATTPSHNTGYFGVYRVGICRIFRGILSGITCTGR